MQIKVTKKTKFEVEFFARSAMRKNAWSFALPTINVWTYANVLKISFYFAFWCAGLDVWKAREE